MVTFNICYLLWIAYMILEGFRDAHYYNSVSLQFYVQDKQKRNLHPFFTIQRMIVAALINIMCIGMGWKLILLNLAIVACQPFFHNGMYYRTRNVLNPKIYKKRWFDMSTTSTAVSTKFETPIMRIIGVAISVALMITLLFL